MNRPLIYFAIVLAVAALASGVCNGIVFAMIRRVNRAQRKGAPLRFFGSSWRTVVAEYRKLHRKTILGHLLIASSCVAFLAVLLALWLIFWAVPHSLAQQ